MNKSKKIIALALAVLVLALVVVPSILKKKVTALMIEEVETQSDYQVKYGTIDVSFFRNFPRVKVELNQFLLQSPTETVLDVDQFKAELSLSKVLKNQLELKSAELISPKINYTLPATSEADISDKSLQEATSGEGETHSSNSLLSSLQIQSFIISDGEIHYQTEDSLAIVLLGIDMHLSGQLDAEEVLVKAQLSVAAMDYKTQGFSLNDIPLGFDGELLYQSEKQALVLKENQLRIGGFSTFLRGNVNVAGAPDFDLDFDAPKTNIKSVLALLPKTIIKDVEQLEADGDVSLKGFVKGHYENAQSWPAFGVAFNVDEAWFKYADLPQKVENISVKAQVSHPLGTDIDSTVIAIDKLFLQSGDNSLETQLNITNPATDVTVSGSVKSSLDLTTLKQALPMQASDIVGRIDANVSFDGRLIDLEQERYQDFDASGHLILEDYYLKSKAMPQGLSISSASLKFTPERINVQSFKGKLGSSDLQLSGYLSNYFAYLFDDQTLNGVLKLNSRQVNLNEFMAYESTSTSQTSTASAPSSKKEEGPFVVPKSLNVIFNSAVDIVTVDDMLLQQFKGKIIVKNAKLILENLSFKTLDGSVKVNGQYNSQNVAAVYSDMSLSVENVDVAKATKSISVLRKMLPITQTTQGKVSSEMHYFAQLDAKGDVDLQSVRSNGFVASPGLRIANNSSLDDLAKQLKDPRYKDITTSAVKINYKMAKGVITLDPFDVKMVDKNINAGGWYNLDNTLNFRIKTTVKAKEIGGDVSKYIGMVSDVNKPLPVTIVLTGDAKKPDVKYDTREAIKILRQDVSKNLNKDAINSILKSFF